MDGEQMNRLLKLAFVLLIGVSLVLPSFSVDEYRILLNTTSHLGAQHAPLAWIMNATFLLLGSATILSGWRAFNGYWFQRIALIVFGLALMGTGIFQHRPIVEGLSFNMLEDQLHSIFASVVGTAFTLFAISVAFIEKEKEDRIGAILMGLASILLSLLIFRVSSLAGIWQRAMFFLAFGWMVLLFERWTKKDKKIDKIQN
ncbi:DUF998 domain-containing protein [Alkalibacter rhizosphaerae]|uniref:DUF998 domain-containing protein n=1 Tax=Alkalibacter rhizosphaerae TaxID=2815577 RepID=A0A974XGL4_9FIRM|nr:DUF998 domain-containing protein [Alkalibacter rhizosphaerae]QSX09433.1 DUF998 domain-containing protein [Alkalibacter rhizosphaerae]